MSTDAEAAATTPYPPSRIMSFVLPRSTDISTISNGLRVASETVAGSETATSQSEYGSMPDPVTKPPVTTVPYTYSNIWPSRRELISVAYPAGTTGGGD